MWLLQQFSSTCCTSTKVFTAAFCSVVDVSPRFCSPHSGSASWRASPGPGSHSDSSVLLCDPLPSGANRAGNSRMASNPPHLQLCRWEGVKRCAEVFVRGGEQSRASPVGSLPAGKSPLESKWTYLMSPPFVKKSKWTHLMSPPFVKSNPQLCARCLGSQVGSGTQRGGSGE